MNTVFLMTLPRAGASALGRAAQAAGWQCSGADDSEVLHGLRKLHDAGMDVSGLLDGRVVRSHFIGRLGLADAFDWWVWLLETWPEARMVFVTREQGEVELSMMATAAIWRPAYGKCPGMCGGRVKAHGDAMRSFHVAEGGRRTVVVDRAEFADAGALAAKLAAVGVEIPAEVLEGELKVVENPRKGWKPPVKKVDAVAKPGRHFIAKRKVTEAGVSYELEQEGWPPVHVKTPASQARPVWRYAPVEVARPVRVSYAIMAHESRRDGVEALLKQLPAETRVVWDDGRGLVRNGAAAWEAMDPAAEYHVVIQDDAKLAADFVREVEAVLAARPEPEAVSFYMSGLQGRRRTAAKQWANGIHGVRGRLRWGPAIALPTAWVPGMLAHYRKSKRVKDRQYDSRIGDWLEAKGRKAYYPLPCLVEHAGAVSIAGHGERGPRKAALFFEHPREIEGAGGERAIVIPWLAAEAEWEELRYALRSIWQHFEDKECPIHIFGDEAPEWLRPGQRVRWHRVDYRHGKAAGLWKAREAGLQVAGEVLWMYDDQYLLRSCGWEDFRVPWCNGLMPPPKEEMTRWEAARRRAALDLRAAGYRGEVRDFATHMPYLFEREKALEVIGKFAIPHRGGLETLYFNWTRSRHRPLGGARVRKLPAGPEALVLNHAHGQLTEALKRELIERFPERAPWEL